MSSPLINCWRSRVILFGATYSAQAVSMDFDMKSEITGRFITFGSDFAIGTTEILMRGRPMRVTSVLLILGEIASL